MDRTASVIDLGPLVQNGELRTLTTATVETVRTERLTAQVLQGKKLFYDARDPRLARDSYMSCASCHNDAGGDGRVWDMTGFGEGLRNTISLKGRAGMKHGFLHWSANFDEVQDFEGQIRSLSGGTGLMTDAHFNLSRQPLGTRKAGRSADLDALAAYLAAEDGPFATSPYRGVDGLLAGEAALGKAVFLSAGCANCHGGPYFTISTGATALKNIGTIKTTSGNRLGATLNGTDVPTLRDVWFTAPYLHDGSAPTLAAAIQAHAGNTVQDTQLRQLSAYLQQVGGDEPSQ
jgi:cytochrome c peroxidase